MEERVLVAIMAAILKTEIRGDKERDPVREAYVLLEEASRATKADAHKGADQPPRICK